MKKNWKDVVIILFFICVYILLIYEHVLHMDQRVIKELPYTIILLLSIIIMLWGFDKLKTYHKKTKIQQKIVSLSNQYNLNFDTSLPMTKSLDTLVDQLHQKLKEDEYNIDRLTYQYRMIAQITDMCIFEYNYINHTVCNSSNWHAIRDGLRFIEDSINKEYVHPEDVETFKENILHPTIINTVFEFHLRLRSKENSTYYPTCIRAIVLQNKHGELEKMIGTRITQKK